MSLRSPTAERPRSTDAATAPLAGSADSLVEALRRERIGAALFGGDPQVSTLGRFEVHGVLGRGGMGTVLDAHDPSLARRVALKLLHRGSDPEHERRLLREAQALARLSHPHVVQVYEVGTVAERLYIAMERVEGQTLRDWQGTPRSWRECLEVYLQAGAGLTAAHAQGLVHRDFKPANCIIDADGRVRVLDFGLAREASAATDSTSMHPDAAEPSSGDGDGVAARSSRGSALSHTLTRSGALLGTLAYMAPEQLLGQPADAQSDQFGFCVSLFEALHGQRPFAGGSAAALLVAIQEGQLAPRRTRPGLPPVPAAIDRIVQRGLAVARHDRYPSMPALLGALARVPGVRRRARVGALGLAVVASAAAGVLAWPAAGPCDGLRELPAPAWTAEQRGSVEHALQQAAGDDGPAVWAGVARALDDYAARWVEARADACEATHVQRSAGSRLLELRWACLDRRMQRMSALVDQLATADRPGAARAVAAAQALPSLSACTDADERLELRFEVSPQDEPLRQRARQRVDEAWALHQAGRSEQGAARADEAVSMADALQSDPQSKAEARLVRGMVHLDARRIEPARDDLHAAMQAAEQAGDGELRFASAQALVTLETWAESHAAAGAWLVVLAGSSIVDDPRRAAELGVAEASLLLARGRAAEAVERYQAAVERYRSLEPVPALALAQALQRLADAHAASGDPAAAKQAFGEALTLIRREGALLDEARALHDLARAEDDAGEPAAAQEHYRQALARQLAIFGERAPLSVHTRIGLAVTHMALGELEAAEHEALAAKAIFAADPTLDPQSRALLLMMLASLHLQQHDPAAALQDYAEAREGFLAMPEVDHGAVAMAESGAADCLVELGRLHEARPRYEHALAILREHVDPSHLRWMYPQRGLGHLLVEQGEPAAAIPLLERALALHATGPSDPDTETLIRAELERALRATRPSEEERSTPP